MNPLVHLAVMVSVLAPLALCLSLALASLVGRIGERGVGVATRTALAAALAGSSTALAAALASDGGSWTLRLGSWFSAGEAGFAFDLAVDAISLGFATLSLLICNVVAAFSFCYLRREPGYRRYFVQFALFVAGITLVALAGSVEVLFVGWELIGLSSALLVGFFQERPAPVRNAWRVFAVYRLGDAAMLAAAVLVHHWYGHGFPGELVQGAIAAEPARALAISVLLILAVAVKSALWPFSGWLPRAMEGPTPSSAVYYGALSIRDAFSCCASSR
ncbi:MAG: hypothetical protein KatS3mg102_1399 [Planctomycetota bacterium]|nr:MAG: hypothetical protein KatS3mg102_1399 [Planctomycetota bacterium]